MCSTAFKSSCWSLKSTKVPNTIFQLNSCKKCLKAIWLNEEAETFTIRWPSQLQKFAPQASALKCYLQKVTLPGLKIIFRSNKNYWLWLVVKANFLENNFKPQLRCQFPYGTSQHSMFVNSWEALRRPIFYTDFNLPVLQSKGKNCSKTELKSKVPNQKKTERQERWPRDFLT